MLEKILSKIPFKRTIATFGLLMGLSACGDTIVNEYPIDTKEDVIQLYEEDTKEECGQVVLYEDKDGDWFGNKDKWILACVGETKEGYVKEVGDCNDNDPEIAPGKQEICDGKDNDCNQKIDEAVATACYSDCRPGEVGIKQCINGEPQPCSLPQPQEKEFFNGLDDDCDPNLKKDNDVIMWSFPINYCNENGGISVSKDGVVYVLGNDKILYALDSLAESDVDRLLWKIDVGELKGEYLSSMSMPPPVIRNNDSIIVGTNNIREFNSLGELQWEEKVSICVGDVWSSSDLVGRLSLATSLDDLIFLSLKLRDIDLFDDDLCGYVKGFSSQGQLWHNSSGFHNTSLSIGIDGLLYGGIGKAINAINPSTGEVEWLEIMDSYITGTPIFGSDNNLYLTTGKNLISFNLISKEALWEFPTGGEISQPVVDSNGDIYFGSEDGNFYALHPDGTEKWTYYELGSSITPTIPEGDLIYVSHPAGLYVLDRNNGEPLFELDSGKPPEEFSPSMVTLSEEGNLFLCNLADDKVYAIRGNKPLDKNATWPTWQHDSQHTGNINSK
jgi:outer membrane protein assembly factor BamB